MRRLPLLLLAVAADVAELVDALDLGSSIERCGSSSLPVRTILIVVFTFLTCAFALLLPLWFFLFSSALRFCLASSACLTPNRDCARLLLRVSNVARG